MDGTEYEGEERVIEIKSFLKSLPDKIKLYRILVLNDIGEINLDEPGSHYTLNPKQLEESYNILTGHGTEYFMLTVLADRELVDIDETIVNNILYPNEEEITLKHKGKGSKVVKIKKIR
jgi:hypothetical protein